MNRAARRTFEKGLTAKQRRKLASLVALAQSNKASTISGAVTCQMQFVDGEAVPQWVPLFPEPKTDRTLPMRDGRSFKMSDPGAFAARFNADKHDVPFDLEHASEIKAPVGEPAPAVGWIQELQARPGEGVWARVKWNAEGERTIKAGEYRYNSPAFNVDKATSEITQLVSAGLTNRPAMIMPALARVEDENTMDLKALLALLGLDAATTADDAMKKIGALKLSADEAAKLTEAVAQVPELQAANTRLKAELASALATVPGLDKFVPRADYDAALARVSTIEQSIAKQKTEAHNAEVASAITAACVSGKITPATKDFYTATCSTPEGLAQFKTFVQAAPVIAPPSGLEGQKPAGATEVALASELQKKIWDVCGVPEALRGKSVSA